MVNYEELRNLYLELLGEYVDMRQGDPLVIEIWMDRLTDMEKTVQITGHSDKCERTTHPNSLHPCNCGGKNE